MGKDFIYFIQNNKITDINLLMKEKIWHPAPFKKAKLSVKNGAGPNSSENFLESTIAKVVSRLHTYSY